MVKLFRRRNGDSQGEEGVSAELDEQYESGGGVVYCPRAKWNKEGTAAVYANAEFPFHERR